MGRGLAGEGQCVAPPIIARYVITTHVWVEKINKVILLIISKCMFFT